MFRSVPAEAFDDDPHSTMLAAWETDNEEVCYQLHGLPDHDEVLIVGGTPDPDDPDTEGDDRVVAIALNREELDEAIEILTEIRVKMIERETERKGRKGIRRIK
jgi:hypothetical protein